MIDPLGAQQGLSDELRTLQSAGTVQVLSIGVKGGSGSFIAPNLVLSCAHVVSPDGRTVVDRATIGWNGLRLPGRVHAAPATSAEGLWPYPDLCLIELDAPVPDHPCVVLGEFRDALGTPFYLTGFNDIYHGNGFQGTSARLKGIQELAGGNAWQLADCEIASGMSGGPVLDLRSGVVCGIAKTQRKEATAMGGLMIPADALRARFPDAWKKNQRASRLEVRWNELKESLRSFNPADRLTPDQWQTLMQASEELGLEQDHLERLWREVVGDLGPDPDRELDTMRDLVAALTDVPEGDLDPFARLFVRLGIKAEQRSSRVYLKHAQKIAKSNGQQSKLGTYQDNARGGSVSSMPVVVIRLEDHPPNPTTELQLTVWRYPFNSKVARQADCAAGPYEAWQLEEIVTKALADQMRGLGGQPLIEFVMPDRLLDEPVERWQLKSERPLLGEDYPVVVRFGSRDFEAENRWQSRHSEFQTGKTPPLGSASWTDLWVCCDDKRDWRELNRVLQREGSIPLIAMTAWRPWNGAGSVPLAVDAGRHAGASIIVWHHSNCRDHSPACDRIGFPDAITSELAGVEFPDLPQKIRELRLEAVGHRGEQGYAGHGVAILWDNPARRPWIEGPRNQDPSSAETDW